MTLVLAWTLGHFIPLVILDPLVNKSLMIHLLILLPMSKDAQPVLTTLISFRRHFHPVTRDMSYLFQQPPSMHP